MAPESQDKKFTTIAEVKDIDHVPPPPIEPKMVEGYYWAWFRLTGGFWEVVEVSGNEVLRTGMETGYTLEAFRFGSRLEPPK